MAREIWLGPILGPSRPRLLERCAELISPDRAVSLLYLAASHPLLELVAGRLLDGQRNRGVWGSLPVHLFRGFVREVLAGAVEDETGRPLAPRTPIDQEELPLKHSLLSQIIRRLAATGSLRALGPLAERPGSASTIASLIGEIQRAAKSPEEFDDIIEARARDLGEEPAQERGIPLQIDYDCDVALVYRAYLEALDRFRFTDDDADQLRALEVLRGEAGGKKVSVPWLTQVQLLVLDGFFDFTPVQGEMLRLLIPRVPDVIVNLNYDELNAEVFRPYHETLDQLHSMGEFVEVRISEASPVTWALAPLRARLFNTSHPPESGDWASSPQTRGIRVLRCSDRETEIRAIAKEVKRLVINESYGLDDIALVVRERASYADTIAAVFEDYSIPCALERRLSLKEVPAVRALRKLLEILLEPEPKMTSLADLIKSGYFRLSDADLADLGRRFERDSLHLLTSAQAGQVGDWDPDNLENVVAYVGSELRVGNWLQRARRLSSALSHPRVLRSIKAELVDDSEIEQEDALDTEVDKELEQPEYEEVIAPPRRPRPSRELSPAAIAWGALVVAHLSHLISALPRQGQPRELRDAVMRLLERLEFAAQVREFQDQSAEVARAVIDLRGLELVRRAFKAAVRGIEAAECTVTQDVEVPPVRLGAFVEEALDAIDATSLRMGGADRDGIRVFEATDVRGLRFPVIFIAGLVEGGFPLRTSRDWIYPQEERERLKDYGLTLEDRSPATLLKEEHYFYQAACRATERLYLTRPLVLEDGSETVASYYIDELKQAVAPQQIKDEVVSRDFDGRELFSAGTEIELAVSLVRQSERSRHRAQAGGLLPLSTVEDLLAWARQQGHISQSALRRIEIEHERATEFFGRFDGLLTDRALVAMLADSFGPGHTFSASELSLYGKCPFKFFAQNVMRLERRSEAALDLTALDAGRLLHEILRRFLSLHKGQGLTSIDPDRLSTELQQIADQVLDEHEHIVPPLNPQVWRIDREIRKVLLAQVLRYELGVQASTASTGVRPAYLELAFGMESDRADPASTLECLKLDRMRKPEFASAVDEQQVNTGRPLELRSPDAQSNARWRVDREDEPAKTSVLVRGQIDRVDLARDGTAIAYDYKLSSGPGLDDMEAGRELQLHIYLAALEQLFLPGHQIAGAGYYRLRGKQDRRNRGLYRAAFRDYTGIRSGVHSNLSQAGWEALRKQMEQRIWEFIDGMRAGRFQVAPSAPSKTCNSCDYSAACRYDRYRIGVKQRDLKSQILK